MTSINRLIQHTGKHSIFIFLYFSTSSGLLATPLPMAYVTNHLQVTPTLAPAPMTTITTAPRDESTALCHFHRWGRKRAVTVRNTWKLSKLHAISSGDFEALMALCSVNVFKKITLSLLSRLAKIKDELYFRLCKWPPTTAGRPTLPLPSPPAWGQTHLRGPLLPSRNSPVHFFSLYPGVSFAGPSPSDCLCTGEVPWPCLSPLSFHKTILAVKSFFPNKMVCAPHPPVEQIKAELLWLKGGRRLEATLMGHLYRALGLGTTSSFLQPAGVSSISGPPSAPSTPPHFLPNKVIWVLPDPVSQPPSLWFFMYKVALSTSLSPKALCTASTIVHVSRVCLHFCRLH